MKPSIIGRERFIVDALANDLLTSVKTRFDHNDVTDTRRGSEFDLRLPSGHVVRVTVELDRYDPSLADDAPASYPTTTTNRAVRTD